MKGANGRKSSVVWTVSKKLSLNKNSKDDFEKVFLKNYDNYFGKVLKISKPQIYPLNMYSCYDCFRNKLVLIGDACQAIHPIAGQGFNLGVRDANSLAKEMQKAKHLGLELSDQNILRNYSRKRFLDKLTLVNSTNLLNSFFSNNLKTIQVLRKLGLYFFNKSDLLKKRSMLIAMGLDGFQT